MCGACAKANAAESLRRGRLRESPHANECRGDRLIQPVFLRTLHIARNVGPGNGPGGDGAPQDARVREQLDVAAQGFVSGCKPRICPGHPREARGKQTQEPGAAGSRHRGANSWFQRMKPNAWVSRSPPPWTGSVVSTPRSTEIDSPNNFPRQPPSTAL